MTIKLLQKEWSTLVSVDGYSFDFRADTHELIDDGAGKVSVKSKITDDIEIYQTDISEFKDLSGSVVSATYADLLNYLSYSDGHIYEDESVPANKYTISVSAGVAVLNLL